MSENTVPANAEMVSEAETRGDCISSAIDYCSAYVSNNHVTPTDALKFLDDAVDLLFKKATTPIRPTDVVEGRATRGTSARKDVDTASANVIASPFERRAAEADEDTPSDALGADERTPSSGRSEMKSRAAKTAKDQSVFVESSQNGGDPSRWDRTHIEDNIEPKVPVPDSVTPDAIICLNDGLKFKTLKKHIMTKYGMTPEQYRKYWNLASDYPLVAPNYSELRRGMAQSRSGSSRGDAAQN